jgi:hypothetical protein
MPRSYAQQTIDFLKQLSCVSTPKELKTIIDKAKGKEIYGVCECILNIINVAGAITKVPGWLLEKLKNFKRRLRQLCQGKNKVTLGKRRGLLRVPSCLKWLPDLLCFAIPIIESDSVGKDDIVQTTKTDAGGDVRTTATGRQDASSEAGGSIESPQPDYV